MTNNQNDPRGKFAPRLLPWLLATVVFLLYVCTLNRWVSMINLPMISRVEGWNWRPDIATPVVLLVTAPFRLLPAAAIPLALNFFSALCAAATLGLLARTVAILPQDRTDAQRRREQSVFSFLTINSAWLAPTIAVAACGLQIVFWQQATNFTGETLQLFFFALVIWLLAEYRIDEKEGRLYLASFIWAASMADNWAMVGFFPVLIAALIWIRGLSFFRFNFLVRMLLFGLAGLLLYLLLPLLITVSGKFPLSFWECLKYELLPQWQVVRLLSISSIWHTLGLISLTTLAPLVLMSIRWKSTFGDSSHNGKLIANFMFHVIHALIFGVCLWVAFDPPFSPHQLGAEFGLAELPSQLTFHYLDALCVGYFCGYLLLVLGRKPGSRSSSKSRVAKKPDLLNQGWLTAIGAVCLLATGTLLWKNTEQIQDLNDPTLSNYGKLTTQNLSGATGYLLCDNNDGPWREWIIKSALARERQEKAFIVLDTSSLQWPMYQHYLHERFPNRWAAAGDSKELKELSPRTLVSQLVAVARTNQVYYLNPSFGYYFEAFYAEPHGLIYTMKLRDTNAVLTPTPDDKLMAENEQFWAEANQGDLPNIEYQRSSEKLHLAQNFADRLLARLHIRPMQNMNIPQVGDFYSESLNYWGVQLQRANRLKAAASSFEQAQKLNPDNKVAGINLEFNHELQAGRKPAIDVGEANTERLGKSRSWSEALNANGPFDSPSFNFVEGFNMARNGYFYQSAEEFNRVVNLAPDNLAARLGLAQAYIFLHQPDAGLQAVQDPLENPAKYDLNPANSTELNVLASGLYFQKNESARAARLLRQETLQHPDNNDLLMTAAQAFSMHGMFTNALEVIDRHLDQVPNDPVWLFGKGYATIQLKRYGQAISAFSLVLTLQTNNNDALFNRAVAYLQDSQYDNARGDYLRLQKSFTNSFLLAYGLGEIAWQQHDTNEIIRNYTLYLANSRTNTPEASRIRDRLNEVKPQ